MPHADAPEHRTLETEGVLDEKDVARLQVEVQQIGAVQGFERLQDLTHQALGERGLERAGRLDSPGHRLPVEQGFDDEEITIGVHARVEGRDEVGVPELVGALRIVEQVLRVRRSRVDVGIEDLDRDRASLDDVLAAIDRTDRTLPDLRVDPVSLGERLTDETDFRMLGVQPGSVNRGRTRRFLEPSEATRAVSNGTCARGAKYRTPTAVPGAVDRTRRSGGNVSEGFGRVQSPTEIRCATTMVGRVRRRLRSSQSASSSARRNGLGPWAASSASSSARKLRAMSADSPTGSSRR
jgi:hypothetical protein